MMDKPSADNEPAEQIDRRSFILGMITGFAECVAAESKKAALSPPFYPDDYAGLRAETQRIAPEQGIRLWFDENEDMSEDNRLNWFVLYKFPEVLDAYRESRAKGFNPAWDFERFRDLLSYGIAWGEGAEWVVPRMREKESIMDTVSRVLLEPGDWPPARA